jgi:hypothetical protein
MLCACVSRCSLADPWDYGYCSLATDDRSYLAEKGTIHLATLRWEPTQKRNRLYFDDDNPQAPKDPDMYVANSDRWK